MRACFSQSGGKIQKNRRPAKKKLSERPANMAMAVLSAATPGKVGVSFGDTLSPMTHDERAEKLATQIQFFDQEGPAFAPVRGWERGAHPTALCWQLPAATSA